MRDAMHARGFATLARSRAGTLRARAAAMHALRSAPALAVLLAAVVAPTAATARPITAGISAGATQSKVDADQDANRTLGLYGRIGLTKRIAAQLELSKLQLDDATNYDGTTIRKMTALIAVDLLDRGALMPVLFAGMGIDRASNDWSETTGDHIEGGLGLEYRAEGGLTLGLDVRLGGRSIDQAYETLPVEGDVALHAAPSQLREGEYRTARLTLGIRF